MDDAGKAIRIDLRVGIHNNEQIVIRFILVGIAVLHVLILHPGTAGIRAIQNHHLNVLKLRDQRAHNLPKLSLLVGREMGEGGFN